MTGRLAWSIALSGLLACGGELTTASRDGGPDATTDHRAVDAGACPAGESLCGATCVNEQTDDHHCGRCGHVCRAGNCRSGSCTCSDGQSECDGGCVDEQTDDANCGGCGLACDHCVGGHCLVTLATGDFLALALDSTTVYWLDWSGCYYADAGPCAPATGKVMSVPKSGGAAATLASGQVAPRALAVDDTRVYWTNAGPLVTSSSPHGGEVLSVPKSGGTPLTLASDQGATAGIAVDGTDVYWAASYWVCPPKGGSCSTHDKVLRAPKMGGTPFTVASSANWLLELSVVAVDGTDVYWTDEFGSVMKALKAGGRVSTLASGLPAVSFVGGLAVDPSTVFMSEVDEACDGGRCFFASGSIRSVDKDGGHRKKLATGLNNLALAMDDQSVYWVDSVGGDAGSDASGFGNVMSTPKDGGSSTPVVSEQENPGPIAVDSTSLYWAVELCASDGGACTGRLLKLTPK